MFNVSTGGALRGEIFHRLFEEVNWLEEFNLQDDDLLHTLGKFDVIEETLRQYLEEFRLSLREGNVVKHLTRANQPTQSMEPQFNGRHGESDVSVSASKMAMGQKPFGTA